MNETFDTDDMNITLNTFGSAPILREGEAVRWDEREPIRDNHEYEVEVEIDGAEEINE